MFVSPSFIIWTSAMILVLTIVLIALAIVVYVCVSQVNEMRGRVRNVEHFKKQIDLINRDIRSAYAQADEAKNKAEVTAFIVKSMVDSPVNGRHVRNEDDHNEQH